MLRNQKNMLKHAFSVATSHLEEVKWTFLEVILLGIFERTHKVGSVSLLKYFSRILVSTTALSNTPLTSCPDGIKSMLITVSCLNFSSCDESWEGVLMKQGFKPLYFTHSLASN